MQVNPNEAPEGYIAVEGHDCRECAFIADDTMCLQSECYAHNRIDGLYVIFIKKE